MRDFSSNETPRFLARLLSLFFVVKNRGKRIKTNQQTLEISRIFRFVFIIVYGHSSTSVKLQISGGSIKAVQSNTAHAQARMVTDLYAHIDNEDRRQFAQKVEQDFFLRMNSGQQTTAANKATSLSTAVG